MRKDIPLFLTGAALFLYGCATEVQAKNADPSTPTPEPPKTFFDPTLAPTFQGPTFKGEYSIPTITSNESLFPLAENCILPFDGALMDGGLQFLTPILTKSGKQDYDNEGRPLKHLGLDFKGNNPLGGDTVLNMCDGTFVFSGNVRGRERMGNDFKDLGNVVVIKYTYLENGVQKGIYMIYAHMKNIIDSMAPGDVIPKGTKIGEVSNSGGWRNPHLHINAWTEDAWNYLLNSRFNGSVQTMAGFYPDGEFDNGDAEKYMVDPKAWLLERLQK